MTTQRAGTILRHIRQLVESEATRSLTDTQLLQRFAARRLLQRRLAHRGVMLSAALCAGVLWKQTAAAAVPAALAKNTVQAATGSAEGVSAAATTLADGVLRVMGFARRKLGGALILGLSLLAVGCGRRVPRPSAALAG